MLVEGVARSVCIETGVSTGLAEAKEKAELASQLIKNIDNHTDEDFDNLWREEILQRDKNFTLGEEPGIDWEEIKAIQILL